MTALAYWKDLGGERMACSWAGFDMTGLPSKLLPTTLVVDIHPDSADNRYRYWGSQMTSIHGRDMTGESPYDIDPEPMREILRRQHVQTAADKVASASRYAFFKSNGVEHFHYSLRLPLSDDGETVSQIVVVVDMTSEDIDFMADS